MKFSGELVSLDQPYVFEMQACMSLKIIDAITL